MVNNCTWRRLTAGLILGCAFAAAGCGGKSISDLASSVKDAASQGVESVQEKAQQISQDVAGQARGLADKASEAAQLAGTMKLTLDQPLEISACYANFSWLQAAGTGVLQLQSYRDARQESFPSVFLRVQHSAAAPAQLTGQTFDAQMFVQQEESGPLWTATDPPIQLKITSLRDKVLRAEIVEGNLVHSGTGASTAVTGSFEGVLP
jgi:hypothetical protein